MSWQRCCGRGGQKPRQGSVGSTGCRTEESRRAQNACTGDHDQGGYMYPHRSKDVRQVGGSTGASPQKQTLPTSRCQRMRRPCSGAAARRSRPLVRGLSSGGEHGGLQAIAAHPPLLWNRYRAHPSISSFTIFGRRYLVSEMRGLYDEVAQGSPETVSWTTALGRSPQCAAALAERPSTDNGIVLEGPRTSVE